MSMNKALRQFAMGGTLPLGGLQWTLDQWNRASPGLLRRLDDFAARRDRSGAAGLQAFYIVHLCGDKGDTGAYAPLCRMIAEDSAIDEWLGDAVTENLPGILIKVFAGDVSALQRAIESSAGYEFARASALAALGYLVRSRGVMTDAEMAGYLRRIRDDFTPYGASVMWAAWAATAANLGFVELRGDVESLIGEGLVSTEVFDLDCFDQQIELALSDASGLAGFESDYVAPLDDAISALERLSTLGDYDDFEDEVARTRTRPASLSLVTRQGQTFIPAHKMLD